MASTRAPVIHGQTSPSPSSEAQEVVEGNDAPTKSHLRLVQSAEGTSGPVVHLFQTGGAAMPRVDVATIGKVASATVFMFCALTLILFWISGFYVLYPPLAVLFMAISAAIFAVSHLAGKQGRI